MARISARLVRSGATRRVMPHLRTAVHQAVGNAALNSKTDAQLAIQSGNKTGRIYTRKGVSHQASAPGEAPAHDTGNLASHISAEKIGHAKFDVVSNSEVAVSLEYGTSKMAPRPYMRPAIDKNKIKLDAELRKIMKQSAKKASK